MPFSAPQNEVLVAGGFSAPDDEVIQDDGLASKAVSAIAPEVNGPSEKESFLSRLARGTRETFFPTSMGEVKRLFNPNLGQYGVSKILEEEGKRVGSAVRGAADRLPPLPIVTVAEGMADSLTPSAMQQNLGAEGAGAALAAGAKAAAPLVKKAAVDPARRALGFQKTQMISQKSPFETSRKVAQANRSAEAMLEGGAISPTGNLDDTIQGATKILQDNSRTLSGIIDQVDEAGKRIPINKIDSRLIDELKPKFNDEFKVADQILDDLKVYSKDGLSIREADELRARWGKIGFQDKTVNSTASDMYRKAWGAVDKIVKGHIESVSPDLAAGYKSAKAGQENAINALRGLQNKNAGDLGNNLFSLPTKVLAAGQLASGDIPGALATAGVMEVVKRRGLAPVARGTFGAGKMLEKASAPPGFLATLSAAARRALEKDRQGKTSPKGSSVLTNLARKAMEPDATSSKASVYEGIPQAPRLSKDMQAYRMGLESLLKKDPRGAKTHWIAALRINPKNMEARRGLERLAQKEGKDIDTYRRQAGGKL